MPNLAKPDAARDGFSPTLMNRDARHKKWRTASSKTADFIGWLWTACI
jgi:hypothetical protein